MFVQTKLSHLALAPLLQYQTKQDFSKSIKAIQLLYEKATTPIDFKPLLKAFGDANDIKGKKVVYEGLASYFKHKPKDINLITNAGNLRSLLASPPYAEALVKWSAIYNEQANYIKSAWFKLDESMTLAEIKQQYIQGIQRLNGMFDSNSRVRDLMDELPPEIAISFSGMIQNMLTEKKEALRQQFEVIKEQKKAEKLSSLIQFSNAFCDIGKEDISKMSNQEIYVHIDQLLGGVSGGKFSSPKYTALNTFLQQHDAQEWVKPWLLQLSKEYDSLSDNYKFQPKKGEGACSLEEQLELYIETTRNTFPSVEIQNQFLSKLPIEVKKYFDIFTNEFIKDLIVDAEMEIETIKKSARTLELKSSITSLRENDVMEEIPSPKK